MASLRIHPPGRDKTVDVALAFGALIMLQCLGFASLIQKNVTEVAGSLLQHPLDRRRFFPGPSASEAGNFCNLLLPIFLEMFPRLGFSRNKAPGLPSTLNRILPHSSESP